MSRSGVVAIWWLCAASAWAAPPELGDAQRAMRELRWADARALIDGLLKAGGRERGELAELYEASGEVAAVLDGADAAEREFRKALALDPSHAGPQRSSPVFKVPFERARRFVDANGGLTVELATPKAGEGAIEILVRPALDPLGLLAGARVYWRAGPGAFQRVPEVGLRARVTAPAGATAIEYYVEALDAAGDVIDRFGSDSDPMRVALRAPPARPIAARPPEPPAKAPPAKAPPTVNANAAPPALVLTPPPRRSLKPYSLAALLAAPVFLAVGIGLNVAAHNEYDSLQHRCAPNCLPGDLSTLHAEEGVAIASYTFAAAAAVTSLVLFLVERFRR